MCVGLSVFTRVEYLSLLQREGLCLKGGVTGKKANHSDKWTSFHPSSVVKMVQLLRIFVETVRNNTVVLESDL